MVLLTLRKVLGPSTQPHGNGRFQECLHIPQSGARCWGWITTHHLQSHNPSRLPWPTSPPEGPQHHCHSADRSTWLVRHS